MTANDDAARWLAAARSGSTEAFGQMLRDSQAYLLLIARRELDPDLQAKCGASDLVQQTLLEACRDFKQFHGTTQAEFLAWLQRLMLNNLSNVRRGFRRSAKRRLALERRATNGKSDTNRVGEICSIGEICATGPSPSEHAIENEQEQALECAMRRLPDDYRRVLLLRYKEQLSFEAIGRLEERSANAVEKLWLRAVERLRQELGTPP